jgi:hypothetical protein
MPEINSELPPAAPIEKGPEKQAVNGAAEKAPGPITAREVSLLGAIKSLALDNPDNTLAAIANFTESPEDKKADVGVLEKPKAGSMAEAVKAVGIVESESGGKADKQEKDSEAGDNEGQSKNAIAEAVMTPGKTEEKDEAVDTPVKAEEDSENPAGIPGDKADADVATGKIDNSLAGNAANEVEEENDAQVSEPGESKEEDDKAAAGEGGEDVRPEDEKATEAEKKIAQLEAKVDKLTAEIEGFKEMFAKIAEKIPDLEKLKAEADEKGGDSEWIVALIQILAIIAAGARGAGEAMTEEAAKAMIPQAA